ncbi:MAG: DUF721 domain-containing protein [Alphaproteobacteria bacterium]
MAAGRYSSTIERRSGMRALGAAVARITAPAFRRRGFAEAGILTDWPHIVGSQLASQTEPERLSFARGTRVDGTLQVRVSGAWATELQHLAPQVIERVNSYFGYRAVDRLAILQAPLSHAEAEPTETSKRPGDREHGDSEPALDSGASNVENAELRSALISLGAAVKDRPGRD